MLEAWLLADPVRAEVFRIGTAAGAGACVLLGERQPASGLVVRWQMGTDRPSDFVWSSAGDVVLLSEKVQATLRRAGCVGWCTWPVELIGRWGEPLSGYSALTVTGRAGPIDYSAAGVVWRELPGGRYPYVKGMRFFEHAWDGSDLFIEHAVPGAPTSLGIYASARAVRALRDARAKNVAVESVATREVSAAVFPEHVTLRWPSALREAIEARRRLPVDPP